MWRKWLACILMLSLLIFSFGSAEEVAHPPVAVLFTNDVHCGIDEAIGYAGLKAYERALQDAGYQVALVDNGDAVQGGPVGTLSKGSYIIDIMNYVGYDVATVGNHEFDYGMDQFMALRERAEFPYVSANFCDLEGNTVLDPYVILTLGDYQVAFVGASAPDRQRGRCFHSGKQRPPVCRKTQERASGPQPFRATIVAGGRVRRPRG